MSSIQTLYSSNVVFRFSPDLTPCSNFTEHTLLSCSTLVIMALCQRWYFSVLFFVKLMSCNPKSNRLVLSQSIKFLLKEKGEGFHRYVNVCKREECIHFCQGFLATILSDRKQCCFKEPKDWITLRYPNDMTHAISKKLYCKVVNMAYFIIRWC